MEKQPSAHQIHGCSSIASCFLFFLQCVSWLSQCKLERKCLSLSLLLLRTPQVCVCSAQRRGKDALHTVCRSVCSPPLKFTPQPSSSPPVSLSQYLLSDFHAPFTNLLTCLYIKLGPLFYMFSLVYSSTLISPSNISQPIHDLLCGFHAPSRKLLLCLCIKLGPLFLYVFSCIFSNPHQPF